MGVQTGQQGGQAVQLVHGKKRELTVPDVFKQLDAFKDYEWLHIIDLDAATGEGSNEELARVDNALKLSLSLLP